MITILIVHKIAVKQYHKRSELFVTYIHEGRSEDAKATLKSIDFSFDEKAKLVEKQQKLLSDIKLFYEIEDELLNKLEEHGLNKNSTKVQVRKIVSDKNGGKKLSDNSKPSVFNK